MKKGDIVWFFTAGHELKYGEIIRRDVGGVNTIRDNKGRIFKRKLCQLAIKEERCKKSKE